jgi:hypothetical protein
MSASVRESCSISCFSSPALGRAHVAGERPRQLVALVAEATDGQVRHRRGRLDALGEGHDNRSTRLTEDVRHDPRELEACSFQQFDDPVLAGRLLADSLLSVSGEDPQVLLSFVRQEARTHQTVHHELR